MTFPHHEPAWVAAADFVARHRHPGESILAPDAFAWRFERIFRYRNTLLQPAARYDWAAVHYWMLGDLAPDVLAAIAKEARPVFANDQFVVWSRRADLPRIGRFDRHLRQFRRNRRQARRGGAGGQDRAWPEPVLADSGAIVNCAALDLPGLKRAMDLFYEHGGYRFEKLKDQVYDREVSRWTRDYIGSAEGLRILDIGCGIGRVAGLVGRCRELVNADLAEVPLRALARQTADRPELLCAVMNAEALALPGALFDLVAFIDSIEHVHHAERALDEIARVLKPGGRLVITCQNRNSLHLVINRKLGYPDFMTNYQHIREFTVAEMGALLAARGLAVERQTGINFFPYWGIPGVEERVRAATDEDAETAEIMRILGERAGPEYAYSFMLDARKIAGG